MSGPYEVLWMKEHDDETHVLHDTTERELIDWLFFQLGRECSVTIVGVYPSHAPKYISSAVLQSASEHRDHIMEHLS